MNDTTSINADMEGDFDLLRLAVEDLDVVLDRAPDLVTQGQEFEDRGVGEFKDRGIRGEPGRRIGIPVETDQLPVPQSGIHPLLKEDDGIHRRGQLNLDLVLLDPDIVRTVVHVDTSILRPQPHRALETLVHHRRRRGRRGGGGGDGGSRGSQG